MPIQRVNGKGGEDDQNYFIVYNPSLFTQDRFIIRLPQANYKVKIYNDQTQKFVEEPDFEVVDFPNVNHYDGPADVVELTIPKRILPLSYILVKIQLDSEDNGRNLLEKS